MELLGVVTRAPVFVQQAQDACKQAMGQNSHPEATALLLAALRQVSACCFVHTTVIAAVQAMPQQLAEADAMRVLAASAAPLQAAPAALAMYGYYFARANSSHRTAMASDGLGELLAASSGAVVSLLRWLQWPTVPARVRQLAERRTLTPPGLMPWLRRAALAAKLFVHPSTGEHCEGGLVCCGAICHSPVLVC
jgi:hypothetical protein